MTKNLFNGFEQTYGENVETVHNNTRKARVENKRLNDRASFILTLWAIALFGFILAAAMYYGLFA